MNALRPILLVARYEFLTTVRRTSYLVVTFGLPLLFALVAALFGFIALGAVGGAEGVSRLIGSAAAPITVHVVDEAGVLGAAKGEPAADGGRVRSVEAGRRAYLIAAQPDLASARAALREGRITGFLHLPADFLAEGEADFYTAERPGLVMPAATPPVRPWLAALLTEGRLSEDARRRVIEGASVETFFLGADGGFAPRDAERGFGARLTPLGLTLFLLVALVTSSSYLLQGLVDEKENRVLEILVSCIETERLLWGKLLGLGAAGVLQVLIWGSALWSAWLRAALAASPGLLALGVLYLVLGYLMLGGLMLGFGALGSNSRESYQLAGGWIFLTVFPTYFAPLILQAPDSALARALSLFPFTAAYFMPLRASAHAAAPWEIAVSLALIAGAAWLALKASARLVGAGALLYGRKPTPRAVARAVLRGE